jgi:hypothetical protein
MKFNIKYSRLGNKFFFISNLSEWHFSCRQNYNEVWKSIIGKLNTDEQKYLLLFKKILQKYGFNNYLGLHFIIPANEKSAHRKLNKIISKKEFEIIKKTFDLFEDKFKIVWQPSILQNNKKVLEKIINKYSGNLFKDVSKLFGVVKRNFNIYLIHHPYNDSYVAGGANIKKYGVTMECNKLSLLDINTIENAISVILHEFFHMIYGKKVRVMADSFCKNENSSLIPYRSEKNIVEEIVAHAMFSGIGYLSNKYLFKESHKKIFNKFVEYEKIFNELKKSKIKSITRKQETMLYYFVILKIYPMINKYLHNNKKVDSDFISKIVEILKN